MAEETRHDLEQIGTAANLMMEAVDKASQDLEDTVKAATEHLQTFNQSLAKNFAQRLEKMAENALRASDKSVEELQARKEDFVERLLEVEQTELETLLSVGKDVRQELNYSLNKAVTMISELVEEQIETLRPVVMSRHENFSSLITEESEMLKNVAQGGISSVTTKEADLSKRLLVSVEEFESRAKVILEETRQTVKEKTQTTERQLVDRIAQAQTELNQYIEQSKEELEEKVKAGSSSLSTAGEVTIKRLSDEVNNWQTEMNKTAQDFKELLSTDADSYDQVHKGKIGRQVDEVKEELKTIEDEAQGRLLASHKLFQGSLRRLENKYHERLGTLLEQFEAAIAQENRVLNTLMRPNMDKETSHELKELLNTRLKARGLEIIKAFKRQVELFDIEHARFVAGCSERIETVHVAAKDSLEQQVKSMNAETDRVLRGFKVEISQLNLQLPQIKDAGHAAALAVMAYNRVRLPSD